MLLYSYAYEYHLSFILYSYANPIYILKSTINILSSDNKIQFAYKHASFNKDVIYYKDKSNNVYVYYDSITTQYLGYSEDNKNIKTVDYRIFWRKV